MQQKKRLATANATGLAVARITEFAAAREATDDMAGH
ncbi:uncharacterized protein G2W53_028928 [Senna tora]|uniref:Uncharacterized protein n=1 Tax=Senna tora TaxID=362788 RepID=A0A834T384_9FABA|nr:uncharacterized protein G2W53_028928 [Senna tora]